MNPSNDPIYASQGAVRFQQASELNLDQFANTRARAVRLADGSQHAAWVPPGASGLLQLAMTPIMDLEKDEKFEIHLTNARQTVTLMCLWLGQHQNRYTFKILDTSPPAQPAEQMRRKEDGVMAVLSGNGAEASVKVVDVAPGGIGVIAPFKMMLETTMRIAVRCRVGMVNFDAKVVYAREDQELGNYRIGFSITRISPNDALLWDQFMVTS